MEKKEKQEEKTLQELRAALETAEKEYEAAEKKCRPFEKEINSLSNRVDRLRNEIADEIRRNAAGRFYVNDYYCKPNLYYYAIDSVDRYKRWSGKEACIILEGEPGKTDIVHTYVYMNEYENQFFRSDTDALKLREVSREEFEKVVKLADYYQNLAQQLDKDIDDKMRELGLNKDTAEK